MSDINANKTPKTELLNSKNIESHDQYKSLDADQSEQNAAKVNRQNPQDLSRPIIPFFKALFSCRFSDMSIVHRLYLSVGITFALFSIATFFFFFMTQSQLASSASDRVGFRSLSRSANILSNQIIELDSGIKNLLFDNKSVYDAKQNISEPLDIILKSFATLDTNSRKLAQESDDTSGLMNSIINNHLNDIKNHINNIDSKVLSILNVYRNDRDKALNIAYELTSSECMPALLELRNMAEKLNNYTFVKQQESNRTMLWIRNVLLIGWAISLAVIILTDITIRRSLRRDTGKLLHSLHAMAEGDLTTQVQLKARDEIGSIGNLVDYVVSTTNGTLNIMKNDVDKLYDMVNTNLRSIDATNEAISVQRNTAQSVASATAAMESSVDKVTEFARSTLSEVKVAEEASDMCRRTMQDNITTTHTLSERLRASSEAINKIHMMSSQIESIVKTIADIADQTNLLALNATIESARAGESGKGFAIVADEIRELAIKTAKSTKDVSNTITLLEKAVTNSVDVMATCEGEMDNSLQQSSRANSSIEEIMGIIATISDMSEQIVQSCQEQSGSASEINQSIAHISKLAEDSYEQMSELQTNMHALNELATNQATILDKFKLKDSKIS